MIEWVNAWVTMCMIGWVNAWATVRMGGRGEATGRERHVGVLAPRIAFRHLPPNSARIGYATEGALSISVQLSTDAVSALRKVWVLIRLEAT